MNAQERTEFRNSQVWKQFRLQMMNEQVFDPVTKKPLEFSNFQCHHCRLNHDKYNDISDKNAFICLNKKTHETVHKIYNTGKWKEEITKIKPEYRESFTKIFEKMDYYNQDKTELFLFSNHVDYDFDESNKPLVASLVNNYNMPNVSNSHGFSMLLWNPNTKESPKDLPLDTIEYLKYIAKRNTRLGKIMSKHDMLLVAELRHLGLYSSYKNLRKKDQNLEWVKRTKQQLESTIIETTEIINKLGD